MAKYIPPKLDWVRKQVELYESSGGTKGTTLLDTGLPCIIVTHKGNKTGAVRKIPLMRVKVANGYVLVGSMGGQPKNPVWVYNLESRSGCRDTRRREGHEDACARSSGGSGARALVGGERRGVSAVQRLSGENDAANSSVPGRARLARRAIGVANEGFVGGNSAAGGDWMKGCAPVVTPLLGRAALPAIRLIS